MHTPTLPAAALAEIEAAGLTPEQLDLLRKVWKHAVGVGYQQGRKQAAGVAFRQGELVRAHQEVRQEMDARSCQSEEFDGGEWEPHGHYGRRAS